MTPLIAASNKGHLDVVKTLVEAGAYIDALSEVSDALIRIIIKQPMDVWMRDIALHTSVDVWMRNMALHTIVGLTGRNNP